MKTKNLVLMALCAAMMAICSQIAIPLPFSEVPITLSTMGVFLTGAVLEKKYAFLSQVVYLLLGAVGIPVFAQFMGGVGILVGPTGGYLFIFPVMAFVVAWTREKMKRSTYGVCFAGMLLSLLPCYIVGSAWLAFQVHASFYQALWMGVIPFVAFDIIKALASAAIAVPVHQTLTKVISH